MAATEFKSQRELEIRVPLDTMDTFKVCCDGQCKPFNRTTLI